jgi:acetyltransferase-like isoleucine patch superfamily enzyme
MSTKNRLHILGYGEWLGYAQCAAQQLGRWSSIETTVLQKINEYSYDIEKFESQEEGVEYFLALAGDAFGTVREKHLSDLASRGLQFASLIPDEFGKKINSLISSGVMIANNQMAIGFNAFIGPNVLIGKDVTFGRSSTVGANSQIQQDVRVGKNVTLADGVEVLCGTTILNYASIERKQMLEGAIKSGVISSKIFDRIVRISGD